jgi:uncharacterized protein YajQ (UPF0234 family)
MAQQNSFDIVSKVDLQEVDNALNQANKEIIQRYDFKGTKTHIDFNKKENEITIVSDNDYKLKAVIEIIQNKMVKRGISLKLSLVRTNRTRSRRDCKNKNRASERYRQR